MDTAHCPGGTRVEQPAHPLAWSSSVSCGHCWAAWLSPVTSQPILSSQLPQNFPFFLFVVTCQQYFSLSILSQVHPRLAVWFGLGQCLVLEEGVRIHILACRGTLLPGPDVTSLLETTLLNLLPLFHCFVTCNILSVFCLMCSGEILNSFLVKKFLL